MTELRVRFESATETGRLYARYDDESGIVAAESRVARDWPYGIDVDGSLICDLDANRKLANFDLHIPQEHWGRDANVRWPKTQKSGDLVFDDVTVEVKSFDSPVEAIADPDLEVLRIRIGDDEPDDAWALSASCVALTKGAELVGFVVRFVPDDSVAHKR